MILQHSYDRNLDELIDQRRRVEQLGAERRRLDNEIAEELTLMEAMQSNVSTQRLELEFLHGQRRRVP